VGQTDYKGGLYAGKRRALALKALGPDEAAIQKSIRDYLDLRGVVYAVTDARTVQTKDGPRQCVSPEGWPDLTALLPVTGRLWAIEVKTETGNLREAQTDMLALIEASGGLVTVARDCLVIREILNQHLAQFKPAELSLHARAISRLKQVFWEHERARRAKAQLARSRRRLTSAGQGAKLF